jgi:hypothetical protein
MTALYSRRLREGLEYQDFAVERLYRAGIPLVCYSSQKYQNEAGESMAGIEIKFDKEMCKSGNVYFETAEKSDPANRDYVPSGIYRSDNTWIYAIGDYCICARRTVRAAFLSVGGSRRDTGLLRTGAGHPAVCRFLSGLLK